LEHRNVEGEPGRLIVLAPKLSGPALESARDLARCRAPELRLVEAGRQPLV